MQALAGESGGGRGGAGVRGARVPCLEKIAAAAVFSQVTVTGYGKTETSAVHAFTCLWFSVAGTRPVTVILIRDKSRAGFDLALVTTGKNPGIARMIERYAARWAIEVGHRWHLSSCAAFSWLCSLFLAGFVFLFWRCPSGSVVVPGLAG